VTYDALDIGLPKRPGCYELAIATTNEQPRAVYVGRVGEKNRGLRQRVHEHATGVAGDRRFCDKVVAVRRRGFNMFVSYKVTSPDRCESLETSCLKHWRRYHWNTVKMPWGRK
jgi:hypothetical protein